MQEILYLIKTLNFLLIFENMNREGGNIFVKMRLKKNIPLSLLNLKPNVFVQKTNR